jgi:hypothetical protein
MNAPILRKGTRAEQLVQELAADNLAAMRQPGSDSAAAVKQLGYLGWEPVSVLVQSDGWPRPILQLARACEASRPHAAWRCP